ncbi:hypothetical protein BD626DRAFT_568503 [Schizophyllum amplum]|uniref:Protein kinase domain-containing protein n=1 Tax=Schizophyllum amplum TaxID=97359 RepID=A0A550CGG1_9AGAR|nr:hypothetical protein BD626DRAFT_568503 [Auriculariopsis ampla]
MPALPNHSSLGTVVVAASAAGTMLFCWKAAQAYMQLRRNEALLKKLPRFLSSWRISLCFIQIWHDLSVTLQDAGLFPWEVSEIGTQWCPNADHVSPNGYLYVTAFRYNDSKGTVGSVAQLRHFSGTNSSSYVVRTRQGQDAMLRVVAIGEDGREPLRIWRKLATAPHALISTNHVLPLLQEVHLEHITLGLFPLVAQSMEDIFGMWAKNSVGDILNALVQALEALAYVHGLGIAHRDAFKHNFLIQWFPESLKTGVVPVSTPRVFLIDFETAIEFPADCPPSERTCTGLPNISSLAGDPDEYTPPRIPEMATGEPYDPFKLDVWQLATSFRDLTCSTMPPVQELFRSMASLDATERLSADEALSRLRAFLEDTPPKFLLIPPVLHYGPHMPSSADIRAMCYPVGEAPDENDEPEEKARVE